VGGTTGVLDVGATCGVGGVVCAAWGAAEVVGTARGTVQVGKTGDEGNAQGLVVELPGGPVGPPRVVALGNHR
jgi:predicted nicotinamide N-methyase